MSSVDQFGPLGLSRRGYGVFLGLITLASVAAGYELGSVVAGDTLELLWLIPILGGCTVAALELYARMDEE